MDKRNGHRSHSARRVKRTTLQNYTVKLYIPHGRWYASFGRQRQSLEVVLSVRDYRHLFLHIWSNVLNIYRKGRWHIDEVVQNAHVWAVRFVTHYFAVPDPDDPQQWQPLLDAIDFEQALFDPEFEKYGFNFIAEHTSNATVKKLLGEIIENANESGSSDDIQLRIRKGWGRWYDSFNEEADGTYSLVTFPFSNLIPELVPINADTFNAEPFDITFEGYCYLIETFSPHGLYRIGSTLARLYPQKHKVDIGAAVDYVRRLVGINAIHTGDLPMTYAEVYSPKSIHHARKRKTMPSFPVVTAILAHTVWALLRKSTRRRD